MKRALSLILVLVMCLGLCACGAGELSKEEKNLIGRWTCSDGTGFILLSSGNALDCTMYNDGDQAIQDRAWYSGTWEVDGNYLIIHNDTTVRVYKIISDNQVISHQITYTKK